VRIAVVVRSLAFGGMERVAITLAEAFAKEGHESHLIYLNETPNPLPVGDLVLLHGLDLKVDIKRSLRGIVWHLIGKALNVPFRKSYFVWSAFYFSAVFKNYIEEIEGRYGAFDLIVFRGRGTFETVWPLRDERFVFVNEGIASEGRTGGLENWYARLLYKGRRVTSVSNGVQVSFEVLRKSAGFDVSKHLVITNPVDIQTIEDLADADIRRPDSPYIVGVGRFHPVKNFPLLIEAYAYAREHCGLTASLVLVGDGPEKESIKKAIKQNSLEKHVYLPGYTSNPYPWMKGAKLFVLTSRREGLGLVLLEAMACGTDVVATDSPGGVREVLHGELNGRLTRPDKASIARKMMEVMEHPRDDFDEWLEGHVPVEIARAFVEHFVGR